MLCLVGGVVAIGIAIVIMITPSNSPPEKTAIQYLEDGRRLVASPTTIDAGIEELFAAQSLSPHLSGLESTLQASLLSRVESLAAEGRTSEAAILAERGFAAINSPIMAQALETVQLAARESLAKRIQITEPQGRVNLVRGRFEVKGRISPGVALRTFSIDGTSIPIIATKFQHWIYPSEEGPRQIKFVATNLLGITVSKTITIVVDSKKPKNKILNVTDGQVVSQSFTLRGIVTDTTLVNVSALGSTVEATSDKPWEIELDFHSEGPVSFEVVTKDSSGLEISQQIRVIVDGTAPVLDDLGLGRKRAFGESSGTIELRIKDANLKTVRWDGKNLRLRKDGLVRINFSQKESLGWVTHRLEALDQAGNAMKPVQFRVCVDQTIPTLRCDEVPQDVLPGEKWTLKGILSEEQCSISLDGATKLKTSGKTFTLPIQVPEGFPVGGRFRARIDVQDRVGNVADTLKIELPVAQPCNDCGTHQESLGKCASCLNAAGDKACDWISCEKGMIVSSCETCGGNGKKACVQCGGTKFEEPRQCAQCRGSGQIRCVTCQGNGRTEVSCSQCNGKGWLVPAFGIGQTRERCRRCNGHGRLTKRCRQCGGDGQRACPVQRCENGSIRQSCRSCRGTGSGNSPCPNCDRGRIKTKCPQCKGTTRISQHCETCNDSRRCQQCQGTGRQKR